MRVFFLSSIMNSNLTRAEKRLMARMLSSAPPRFNTAPFYPVSPTSTSPTPLPAPLPSRNASWVPPTPLPSHSTTSPITIVSAVISALIFAVWIFCTCKI